VLSKGEGINLKKQAVMPVEFLDLPPVERAGALHGYYIVPSVGTYYASIQMSGEDSILSGLTPLESNTPGYLERDKMDQYLRPWDEVDMLRLKLSPSLARSVEVERQKQWTDPVHGEGLYRESDIDPLEMIKRS